jgi:CBS-domain-containing membrane protein
MTEMNPSPLRRPLRAQLTLALLPTATILIVFALVDGWARQRLLFASLASSAFLIYLDPEHQTNSTRTLVVAQGWAALVGFAAHALLGPTFWAAGCAMVVVIFGMILANAMHPPAVSTALSFAFSAGRGGGLILFGLCLGLVVILVLLQRASVWLLRRTLARERAGR